MVRATFSGFTTAYSALQANQKRLDLVGQNLANMNTTGYTRQQLQASTLNYSNPTSHYMSRPELTVGFGVHMDAITQVRDPYLDIQYRGQMQKSGYSNAMQEALDRLSDVLDESHIDGINQAFRDIHSTLTNVQDLVNVDEPIFNSELRTRMQTLTNLLNDSARQIDEAKMNEYMKLDGSNTNQQGAVEQINDILQQIGRLNRQIKQNQIYGQPSLELMDERNVLIDELSSFIPIEVTYFKDKDHDGTGNFQADGTPDEAKNKAEMYHLDNAGNVIAKKEWPDDLRITMDYVDDKGVSQKLILVEGTIGNGDDNYGKFEMDSTKASEIWADKDSTAANKTQPGDLILKVTGIENPQTVGKSNAVEFFKNDADEISNQFTSGSVQASLDMLWKDGATKGLDDVKGFDFYMDQLDNLAKSFATVMNVLNAQYGDGTTPNYPVNPNDPDDPNAKDYILMASKNVNEKEITAHNIGISKAWMAGEVSVNVNGKDRNNAALDMKEAMEATYPYTNFKDLTDPTGQTTLFGKGDQYEINLNNNSFNDFMSYTSTILANDSYSNQNTLKTNVTVLNGIQNSRDSVSGVSLDEEASNMMMFMSAYNAASRLLTTLDQALDVLINGTGVVGR